MSVNLRTVADHLRRHPDKYRNFGPWWWSMKALLRPYHDFGSGDDPELRAAMNTVGGNDPDRIARLAMREYQGRAGGYQDGHLALPGGEEYYLTDPDVLETANL